MCSGTGDAVPVRLADERAGDQLDLGRPVRLDVLEHRRVVPVAALRREHVHLPRILASSTPAAAGGRLALVDEVAHEQAEVAVVLDLREVEVVRRAR